MPLTVGILAFDGVDELDFVGPLDVFGAANWGRDDMKIVTIANRRDHVRGVNGLKVLPDHDFLDAPQLDVVIVPGGLGVDELIKCEAALEWLRGTAKSARWICSVCTGSFVLEAAGLTKGRRITTHSGAIDLLRSITLGQVVEGQRYVVDGDVVTAAGVSAGIDMSLWVIGQIYGADHARTVQGLLEYYPAPPYSAALTTHHETPT